MDYTLPSVGGKNPTKNQKAIFLILFFSEVVFKAQYFKRQYAYVRINATRILHWFLFVLLLFLK